MTAGQNCVEAAERPAWHCCGESFLGAHCVVCSAHTCWPLSCVLMGSEEFLPGSTPCCHACSPWLSCWQSTWQVLAATADCKWSGLSCACQIWTSNPLLSACLLCLYKLSSLGAALLTWQLLQPLKLSHQHAFYAAGEWPGVLPPKPQPAGLWSRRRGALCLEPGESWPATVLSWAAGECMTNHVLL